MIDEERAKKEAAGQMTFEQKVNLLNDQVNVLDRSTYNQLLKATAVLSDYQNQPN